MSTIKIGTATRLKSILIRESQFVVKKAMKDGSCTVLVNNSRSLPIKVEYSNNEFTLRVDDAIISFSPLLRKYKYLITSDKELITKWVAASILTANSFLL